MTDEKAREILKRHCAAYGDNKYEPARWVIEALQDAVSSEREKTTQLLTHIEDVVDDESWSRIDTKLWNDVTTAL